MNKRCKLILPWSAHLRPYITPVRRVPIQNGQRAAAETALLYMHSLISLSNIYDKAALSHSSLFCKPGTKITPYIYNLSNLNSGTGALMGFVTHTLYQNICELIQQTEKPYLYLFTYLARNTCPAASRVSLVPHNCIYFLTVLDASADATTLSQMIAPS